MEVLEVRDRSCGLVGYLAVDASSGLAFGGLRVHPAVSRRMVVDLARCMTWKLAGHGVPIAGAKAGLRARPDDPRLPEMVRRFARAAKPWLLSRVILGKDMGANDRILADLYGALGVPQLQAAGAGEGNMPLKIRALTGYRRHMTGLGVAWAARAACGGSLKGRRVAIQGFGAVGQGAAVRLSALGARVVAVSDERRSALRAEGFAPRALLAAAENGRLSSERLPRGTRVDKRDAALAADADLLVLAAGSHAVSARQARLIRCPLVVEAANFGLTPGARRLLTRRRVLVVPDVLAGSSSAALVGHQMAAGNGLRAAALWRRIERSISEGVRLLAPPARRPWPDTRQAFIKRVTAR